MINPKPISAAFNLEDLEIDLKGQSYADANVDVDIIDINLESAAHLRLSGKGRRDGGRSECSFPVGCL